jgi:hypothetical protein
METNIIIAIVATGIFFLVTFVTGGLLTYSRTSGKPVNGLVVNIHKFLSILTVIATAATIYMLANGG